MIARVKGRAGHERVNDVSQPVELLVAILTGCLHPQSIYSIYNELWMTHRMAIGKLLHAVPTSYADVLKLRCDLHIVLNDFQLFAIACSSLLAC